MNAQLRVNEALLIADHAFKPFKCIAWAPLDGTGELSLSVLDGNWTRVLGRRGITSAVYRDPSQLAEVLEQARQELTSGGFALQPWTMPA